MRTRRARGSATALAALLAGSPALAAPRPAVFLFDQPAQPLARALLALSERTGVVVLAPAPLVANRQAPALRGALSAPAALAVLLAGSRLTFVIGADGVVTIAPMAAARAAPRRLPLPLSPAPT